MKVKMEIKYEVENVTQNAVVQTAVAVLCQGFQATGAIKNLEIKPAE